MREKCNHSAYTDLCDDCKQANEIDRLRAETARLRALCAARPPIGDMMQENVDRSNPECYRHGFVLHPWIHKIDAAGRGEG